MLVAQILKSKSDDGVVTVQPDATLASVAELLSSRKIGAVVVSADGKHVAGILSERDIVRALAGEGPGALDRPAESYMSAKVVTCSEKETTDQVLGRMTAGRFRHMPVVREDRLIGVISIGDVVARRIELAEREAAEMRAYIATA